MLVKKYSNRRLYDTADSRYITLEELADKIRAGADVKVVDAKTEQELTQATLTQIIIESRGAAHLLPVPLLTQLIRMGDDAFAEFLSRYMSAALEWYVQAKHGAQAVAPYNPFATLPFTTTSDFARLMSRAPAWGPEAWAAESLARQPPPPAPSKENTDLSELRREVEALKRALRKKK